MRLVAGKLETRVGEGGDLRIGGAGILVVAEVVGEVGVVGKFGMK